MKRERAALITQTVGSFTYAGNETLQTLARYDVIDYYFPMGYVSDIGLPVFMVGAGLFAIDAFRPIKNETGEQIAKATAVLVPPILLTSTEANSKYDSNKGTVYDPVDIACFWAGAILAYIGYKTLNKK